MKYLNMHVAKGFVWAAAFLFAAPSLAAEMAPNFKCDGIVRGLIKNNGGCKDGKCKFNVVNGELMGVNGGVVKKDGDRTSLTQEWNPGPSGEAVTNVELVKGKDGAQALTLTRKDPAGKATTMQYSLTAGESECVHGETQSKGPDDSNLAVDYEADFCTVAQSAFDSMEPAQAKSCDDAMGKLVAKFEERSNALSKAGKTFHGASFFEKMKAKTVSVSSNSGQETLMRALKQRDRCTAASNEVALATPLNIDKLFLEKLANGKWYKDYLGEELLKFKDPKSKYGDRYESGTRKQKRETAK